MARHERAELRSLILLTLGILVLITGVIAAGCNGSDNGGTTASEEPAEKPAENTAVKFTQVESTVTGICATCHSAQGIEKLLADINALDDSNFTEANFPDTFFPAGLTKLSVKTLIDTASPADDAAFSPDMAQRKAWVLHELHELKDLLGETVPPDFSGQASYDAFTVLGKPGHYEGCETLEKLELGHAGDPEGMPPLWAEKITGLLGIEFAQITDEERDLVSDYTGSILPGGAETACK